jgi:hypothetical protein
MMTAVRRARILMPLLAWGIVSGADAARGDEPILLATMNGDYAAGVPRIVESRWPVLYYQADDFLEFPWLFEDFELSPPFPQSVVNAVSEQNEPEFEKFVEFLTDGVDQTIMTGVWDGVSGPGSAVGVPESYDLNMLVPSVGPDLVGYEIDHIKQVVTVDLQSPGANPNGDGIWTDWSCTGHYEFYGTPVPEPGAFGVWVLFAVFTVTRRPR